MRSLLALPLLFALTATADPGPAPLPVLTGGRTAPASEGGARFGWPGVYFEGRFKGTGVTVAAETATDHLRVLVDGVEKAVLVEPGTARLTITGLAPGEHVVRLEKLTESQSGGSRLLGFYPTEAGGVLPAPAPKPRAIEFIGDSHSVGYGNTSPVRECTRDEVHDTTNTQLAFGPLLARKLGAEYRVHAYSGYGIVRNYDGGVAGDSLPKRYPRAIPGDSAPAAKDDWAPQLIVINLGTNDFSTRLKPGEPWADDAALRADYRKTYGAFLDDLRKRQPKARFILMAPDNFLTDVQAVGTAAVARKLPVSVIHIPALEMTGCDWHPSLKDHRTMADLVGAEVRKLGVYID